MLVYKNIYSVGLIASMVYIGGIWWYQRMLILLYFINFHFINALCVLNIWDFVTLQDK